MSATNDLAPSAVSPTISLDGDGARHGFLNLPWSHDGSAWGAVRLPLAVVARGSGPTALLVGGNHGDEYEGPVAMMRLAAALKDSEVSGRVIILPCLNLPAVKAARRTSPIDGGNMNRSFPGDPLGTPTQKVADYVARHLIAQADIVVDIHSGGRTLNFIPFACAHDLDDKPLQKKCEAAVTAFNAPYNLLLRELDARGMLDTEVELAGKVLVTTELGGGGTATAASVAIAERGIRNVLKHVGILEGDPDIGPATRLVMPDEGAYAISEDTGFLEMVADMGSDVEKGDVIARIHAVERTGTAPVAYHAPMSGIMLGRHHPGLIGMGDCLAVFAARA